MVTIFQFYHASFILSHFLSYYQLNLFTFRFLYLLSLMYTDFIFNATDSFIKPYPIFFYRNMKLTVLVRKTAVMMKEQCLSQQQTGYRIHFHSDLASGKSILM